MPEAESDTQPGVNAFTRSDIKGISCEEVIKCVLDISEEGWNIYHFLEHEGPLRVDKVGDFLGKDRSTAYRELQKLINCGICYKEPTNIKEGGYYFLYYSRPVDEIKRETERCLDATYSQLKRAIQDNFTPQNSDE